MSERIIDGLNGVEESECFWYDEPGFYIVVLTFLQDDFSGGGMYEIYGSILVSNR